MCEPPTKWCWTPPVLAEQLVLRPPNSELYDPFHRNVSETAVGLQPSLACYSFLCSKLFLSESQGNSVLHSLES